MSTSHNQLRLLRLPEVKKRTGLSKSTIYARMAQGTFPRQIVLGARIVAWSETAINSWIADQIELFA